jgi:hypothetical protein
MAAVTAAQNHQIERLRKKKNSMSETPPDLSWKFSLSTAIGAIVAVIALLTLLGSAIGFFYIRIDHVWNELQPKCRTEYLSFQTEGIQNWNTFSDALIDLNHFKVDTYIPQATNSLLALTESVRKQGAWANSHGCDLAYKNELENSYIALNETRKNLSSVHENDISTVAATLNYLVHAQKPSNICCSWQYYLFHKND